VNLASYITDPDAGDSLTFTTASTLPSGITLDANGLLHGTATATGTQSVTVTATDTQSHTAQQTFTLNEVSAPSLTSTIDNVTNFEVTSNIVLTSTEPLSANAGKFIHIINDVGTGFHGENIVNTQDISVTDTSKVSIVGSTITINPGFDLDFANSYHITVDAGAFTGSSSGQGSIAVTDPTSLNFSTVAPTATLTGAGSASQAMVSGTDAMVAGHAWFDAEANSNPSAAAVTLNMGTGANAIAVGDVGSAGIATNDFYVALTNFGNGDLIYVDNLGVNSLQRQSEFDGGLITSSTGVAPTQVLTGASGTATGLNGGQFDVTVQGSTAFFGDTTTLKVLLGGVTYEPILYG
jgi:hypothetical protein